MVSKSKQSRERWQRLNSNLNESYKSNEAAMLNKRMEDLKLADSNGDYTTTWKIIHALAGKYPKTSVKVNIRDGTPPSSDKAMLAGWREYFSSLLNNDNGISPSELPQPAPKDLPIHASLPTREETVLSIRQMKSNKAAGLDSAITCKRWRRNGGCSSRLMY